MVDGVNQQPGLFQRIGNFFGAGDPNAGSPTDPFANLSRSQRTMLGFAALRDAAASLEGRDSNFFAQSLGGFEQARERERLRAQGETQNRVQALQALATLNEQTRYNRAFGLPTDPATEALREALMTAAGFGGGASPMAGGAPAMPAAVAPTTRLPTGSAVVDASGAVVGDIGDEPLSPAAQAAMGGAPVPAAGRDFDAERQAIFDAMRDRVAARAGTDDLQAQLDDLNAQEAAATSAAATLQQEGEQETRVTPLIGEALDFLVNEDGSINVLGARIAGAAPGVAGGQARLAASAISELAAIAAMGSVRDARAGGFGGALSDADIELIQRSGGTFDLAQPEATVRTLRNIASQLSPDAQAALFGATGGAFVPSADMQSLRDRYLP